MATVRPATPSNATPLDEMKGQRLLFFSLLILVGAGACLQLDVPLPAEGSRDVDEAPELPPLQAPPVREAPSKIDGPSGNEPPDKPSGPQASPELYVVDGATISEAADAQVPPEQPELVTEAGDAGPLSLPESGPTVPENPGVVSGAPCPSGSVVFVEGVRYICGGNGQAYEPVLLWLVSSASL